MITEITINIDDAANARLGSEYDFDKSYDTYAEFCEREIQRAFPEADVTVRRGTGTDHIVSDIDDANEIEEAGRYIGEIVGNVNSGQYGDWTVEAAQ